MYFTLQAHLYQSLAMHLCVSSSMSFDVIFCILLDEQMFPLLVYLFRFVRLLSAIRFSMSFLMCKEMLLQQIFKI